MILCQLSCAIRNLALPWPVDVRVVAASATAATGWACQAVLLRAARPTAARAAPRSGPRPRRATTATATICPRPCYIYAHIHVNKFITNKLYSKQDALKLIQQNHQRAVTQIDQKSNRYQNTCNISIVLRLLLLTLTRIVITILCGIDCQPNK